MRRNSACRDRSTSRRTPASPSPGRSPAGVPADLVGQRGVPARHRLVDDGGEQCHSRLECVVKLAQRYVGFGAHPSRRGAPTLWSAITRRRLISASTLLDRHARYRATSFRLPPGISDTVLMCRSQRASAGTLDAVMDKGIRHSASSAVRGAISARPGGWRRRVPPPGRDRRHPRRSPPK